MRRVSVACLLGILLLCAQPLRANAAFDNSVAGLKLGMSIADVAARLGPDFKQATTVNIMRGQVVNFVNGAEGFNVLAIADKVMYIEHQQYYDTKQEISTDELNKGLLAKYGEPSIHNEEDQSRMWIVVDGKVVRDTALTDQLRDCMNYDTQGPFFSHRAKTNFSFSFPKVPVDSKFASCGTVIQSRPTVSETNAGLVTHLWISEFDVKSAQEWYEGAMRDYNKIQNDAIEAARKNKPNL